MIPVGSIPPMGPFNHHPSKMRRGFGWVLGLKDDFFLLLIKINDDIDHTVFCLKGAGEWGVQVISLLFIKFSLKYAGKILY